MALPPKTTHLKMRRALGQKDVLHIPQSILRSSAERQPQPYDQSGRGRNLLCLPNEILLEISKHAENMDSEFGAGALALTCKQLGSVAVMAKATKTHQLLRCKGWQPEGMRWCPCCRYNRPTNEEYWGQKQRDLARWVSSLAKLVECTRPKKMRWDLRTKEIWRMEVERWRKWPLNYVSGELAGVMCPPCLIVKCWVSQQTWSWIEGNKDNWKWEKFEPLVEMIRVELYGSYDEGYSCRCGSQTCRQCVSVRDRFGGRWING